MISSLVCLYVGNEQQGSYLYACISMQVICVFMFYFLDISVFKAVFLC